MLPLGLIQEYMEKLDNWSLENDRIVKDKQFGTFKAALEFVNKVGEIAEKNKHYPDIVVSGAMVRMGLMTKSERGLTSKDFEIAQEIDRIDNIEKEEDKGVLKGETTDSADIIRRVKEQIGESKQA
jgi:4a-hydroxytetrahydrobiopterin dehydratase